MACLTIDVDVNLREFDDEELIDELESRDWWVSPEKNWEPDEILSDTDKQWICELLVSQNLESTDLVAKEIYEKLRKR